MNIYFKQLYKIFIIITKKRANFYHSNLSLKI